MARFSFSIRSPMRLVCAWASMTMASSQSSALRTVKRSLPV
jgi:hypothetical protein